MSATGIATHVRRWTAENLRSIASVTIILAAWQAAAQLKLTPPLFLPPVTAVVAALIETTADGSLPGVWRIT